MGRDLFDKAFKEYAMRWKFKHPSPADFFRTMEDASAVDLDWFWRGWFFSTEPCDIELADVKWNRADMPEDSIIATSDEKFVSENPHGVTSVRNREYIARTQDEIDTTLRDKYTEIDDKKVAKEKYESYVKSLTQGIADHGQGVLAASQVDNERAQDIGVVHQRSDSGMRQFANL